MPIINDNFIESQIVKENTEETNLSETTNKGKLMFMLILTCIGLYRYIICLCCLWLWFIVFSKEF